MIQQSVNATERSRTTLAIFGIIQLCAAGEEPLVGDAVVPREHLKMSHQVHATELTPMHQRAGASRPRSVRRQQVDDNVVGVERTAALEDPRAAR